MEDAEDAVEDDDEAETYSSILLLVHSGQETTSHVGDGTKAKAQSQM